MESLSEEVQQQRLVDRRYNGLQFGATNQDYILFKTRMDPLEEYYTLCGWLKKRQAGGGKYWFGYSVPSHDNEIRPADNGYFHTLNTNADFSSKVTVELVGVWTHWCYTWSFSTREANVYLNGQLLGSATTPSGRKVGVEGYVVLGNEFNSYGGDFNWPFGGDMFKVNVFDKELDASQVKAMADAGLCSDVEEQYGRSRFLKWEDLLLEEKSGNVTEIDVGCYPEVDEEESNSTEECECEQESFSRWDLLKSKNYFHRTVTTEMVEELKGSWEVLGKLRKSLSAIFFISAIFFNRYFILNSYETTELLAAKNNMTIV